MSFTVYSVLKCHVQFRLIASLTARVPLESMFFVKKQLARAANHKTIVF